VAEPGVDDVVRAGVLVGRHLTATPVVASPHLGADVALKLETFQPTGSFKVRGALVALARALDAHSSRRIVTASAGNHGLGVAFAARTLGAEATVVIPENASEAKRRALLRFDVEVVRRGVTYDEAEAEALALAASSGARFVSAYNDPDVIAGQATVALELFDQVPGLTTVVAPVGGGGLVAGLALATRHRHDVTVTGVETAASRAVSASVSAGRVVTVPIGATLADGLAGNIEAGSVTIALIARGVDEITAVDEPSIADAVRFLAFEHGVVAEPSGAVAVAALLDGSVRRGPGSTVVVVTGRNVSGAVLAPLLEAGR
jgi:threonine dehydratase